MLKKLTPRDLVHKHIQEHDHIVTGEEIADLKISTETEEEYSSLKEQDIDRTEK